MCRMGLLKCLLLTELAWFTMSIQRACKGVFAPLGKVLSNAVMLPEPDGQRHEFGSCAYWRRRKQSQRELSFADLKGSSSGVFQPIVPVVKRMAPVPEIHGNMMGGVTQVKQPMLKKLKVDWGAQSSLEVLGALTDPDSSPMIQYVGPEGGADPDSEWESPMQSGKELGLNVGPEGGAATWPV